MTAQAENGVRQGVLQDKADLAYEIASKQLRRTEGTVYFLQCLHDAGKRSDERQSRRAQRSAQQLSLAWRASAQLQVLFSNTDYCRRGSDVGISKHVWTGMRENSGGTSDEAASRDLRSRKNLPWWSYRPRLGISTWLQGLCVPGVDFNWSRTWQPASWLLRECSQTLTPGKHTASRLKAARLSMPAHLLSGPEIGLRALIMWTSATVWWVSAFAARLYTCLIQLFG